LIRKIAILMMVSLLLAGIAYAKEYEVTKKAGQYDVAVKIDKNPAAVGDNAVVIGITDASGHDVGDAKVELYYFMPSMPSMNYTAVASLEGTRYHATVKPTMGGDWSLDVKFARPGGKVHKVTFSFQAE
jgi:hypothetical protein